MESGSSWKRGQSSDPFPDSRSNMSMFWSFITPGWKTQIISRLLNICCECCFYSQFCSWAELRRCLKYYKRKNLFRNLHFSIFTFPSGSDAVFLHGFHGTLLFVSLVWMKHMTLDCCIFHRDIIYVSMKLK